MWMVLSARWGPLAFCKGAWRFLLRRVQHMRLKLDTMTGTGSAITSTPLSEQMEPKIFPAMVFGTMSPYLWEGGRGGLHV
ncbi:hypothetical protein EYF80_054183 [Liparis tanakae]|uniref:Uncharacterized protein n=1 Tax=Liparis tanakae TaxID=230148 RepID=A0A4Z2F3M8_9TELE|nr:hypothetical protein EYF80_054183 [Liparis tanakae]